MKVLIVQPPVVHQGPCFDIPANMLYLIASLRKAGIESRLADGNMIGLAGVMAEIDNGYDIVGVSTLSPSRFSALKVAQYAKSKGAMTVLGGQHVFWLRQQVMDNYPFVDVIVLGEGENTIVDLATKSLEDVDGIIYRRNGEVIRNRARRYADLDDLPFPAWDTISFAAYHAVKHAIGPRVYYSRGCTGHCKFCNSPAYWRGYRHRSPQNLCEELEWLYKLGEKICVFGDDNATGEDAKLLFQEIEKRLGRICVPVSAATRVDCVDDELCQLMRRCGVKDVCLGIEHGSQMMREHMGKGITTEQVRQAVASVRSAGMKVVALLIQNSIGETDEVYQEGEKFILELSPDGRGGVGALWLHPGTAYYNEVRSGKYDSEIVSGKELVDDAFYLNPEYAQHVIAWKRGVISPQKVTDDV